MFKDFLMAFGGWAVTQVVEFIHVALSVLGLAVILAVLSAGVSWGLNRYRKPSTTTINFAPPRESCDPLGALLGKLVAEAAARVQADEAAKRAKAEASKMAASPMVASEPRRGAIFPPKPRKRA